MIHTFFLNQIKNTSMNFGQENTEHTEGKVNVKIDNTNCNMSNTVFKAIAGKI